MVSPVPGYERFSVPAALHAAAARVPARIAVDAGHEHITYADLVARADATAHAIHDRGLPLGRPVVALCSTDVDAVVSVLGVYHAGRPLVAVDARDPAERLAEIVAVSDAGMIV